MLDMARLTQARSHAPAKSAGGGFKAQAWHRNEPSWGSWGSWVVVISGTLETKYTGHESLSSDSFARGRRASARQRLPTRVARSAEGTRLLGLFTVGPHLKQTVQVAGTKKARPSDRVESMIYFGNDDDVAWKGLDRFGLFFIVSI